MLERIFNDAKDQYVAALVVYGKSADKKLYLEAGYKNQAAQADVADAFAKNLLLVKVGDDFFKPVKISGNKVTIADLVTSSVTLTEYQAKASE